MVRQFLTLIAMTAVTQSDWRVPEGFVVQEYADQSLAPDITCMTIDPRGRLIVAGPGYIRMLLDERDGRATRAVSLASVRGAAMGLLAEGDALYAIVDGALWRWPLNAEGSPAGGAPSPLLHLRTAGEHHAHAVHRGPDGWLYVIVGDGTGISRDFVNSEQSPIRDPIGGCLLRISADGRHREIVADGFRNAYDFSFDQEGFPWTFDSDNERCVSLPWYEPTRIYRILPGAHHGWRGPQRSETWRLPPYFFDVAAPEAVCGRGSPTGVTWQNHVHWPDNFHGLFLADWTFGIIWLFQPQTDARPTRFLQPAGDKGFAPTALAVHPHTGELFVSIGGRGTRGAVYRIAPRTPAKNAPKDWVTPSWAKTVRLLVERRLRPGGPTSADVQSTWQALNESHHRAVLHAAAELLAAAPRIDQRNWIAQAQTPPQWIVGGYALVASDTTAAINLALRAFLASEAPVASRVDAIRLIQIALGDLTATAHRATVWAGYTLRHESQSDQAELRRVLRCAFPTGHPELDREISRTLALLGDDGVDFARKLSRRVSQTSDPIDDIHYLIVLSRLDVPWDESLRSAVSEAMLLLDRKLSERGFRVDRNWPLRMTELHAELFRRDPQLNRALLQHPEFGRPGHALWTRHPKFDRAAAARRFLERSANDPAWQWTPETLALLATLPPEVSQPVARRLATIRSLRDPIIQLLAEAPQPDDRALFREGLTSPRFDVVRRSLAALHKIGPPHDASTVAALILALGHLPSSKEGIEIRNSVIKLLETTTGMHFGPDAHRWLTWLTQTHPEEAAKLNNPDGVDWRSWQQRWNRIDWSRGDTERGKALFHQKALCASCHNGSQALGPDLAGIGQRFSREDRLLAIVQPSRNVSSRYRMIQIETTDGRSYQGVIVYEAADGLILQTGPSETIRLSARQIESRRETDRSLMPAGLLDSFTDQEIADLDAYLRSLK